MVRDAYRRSVDYTLNTLVSYLTTYGNDNTGTSTWPPVGAFSWPRTPAREVERARIVLLAADGLSGVEIAERVGCSEPTVVRWRSRFAVDGLAGLVEEPRSGKPRTIERAVRDEILTLTLTEPPADLGVTHWSSRLLADRLRRGAR